MKKNYPFFSDIKISGDKILKITFIGHWPNPSWQLKTVEYQIDEKNHEIHIQVLGESKGGLALQMLQPFSHTLEIDNLKSNEWRIIIKSRSDDIIKVIVN